MSKTKKKANQTIEELRERFKDLEHRRTRADANRDNSEKRLDELKAAAKENFGTDDLTQLENLLAELTSENEKQRSGYQAELDQIEMGLVEIEEKLADADEDFESEE